MAKKQPTKKPARRPAPAPKRGGKAGKPAAPKGKAMLPDHRQAKYVTK